MILIAYSEIRGFLGTILFHNKNSQDFPKIFPKFFLKPGNPMEISSGNLRDFQFRYFSLELEFKKMQNHRELLEKFYQDFSMENSEKFPKNFHSNFTISKHKKKYSKISR